MYEYTSVMYSYTDLERFADVKLHAGLVPRASDVTVLAPDVSRHRVIGVMKFDGQRAAVLIAA